LKTNRLLAGALSLVLIAGLGTPAFAEQVIYDFEIEITSIDDEDLPGTFDGIVAVGDTITGQYAHDLSVEDQVPANPTIGIYQFEEFSFQFDTVSYQEDPPLGSSDNIRVLNDNGGDDGIILMMTSVVQQSGPTLPSDVFMLWELIDFDATIFDDDSLPLTPPSLADLELNFVELDLGDAFIFGIVTSLEVVSSDVVGGELIPLETTSLILAGAQTFSWMIPLVLSIVGIGLFVFRKTENS